MSVCAPLWTLKTRIILFRDANPTNSIVAHLVAREIYEKEGLRAFYKGYTPSLFLSLYGTLAMTCYECLNYLLGF